MSGGQQTTSPRTGAPAVSVKNRRGHWIVIAAFIAVLLADQITKELVVRYIDGPQDQGKAATFFYLTHARNPGLVFGIFRDAPLVAASAPILASIVLLLLYRHLAPGSWLQTTAFGMVAGGAAGNIYDRFFRGGTVVDFLQFNFYFLADVLPFSTTKYPAFNIADSAICIGVALLLFTWSRQSPDESDASAA